MSIGYVGASTVLALGSPYHLLLHGVWCHLEGVRPGVSWSAERPSSSLTSVDGVRHVQVAARAAREWSLDYEHATAEAIALLQVAASSEAVVMLWDETLAHGNLLAPWETHGTDLDAGVLVCGGVPLPVLPAGAWGVGVPVRGGHGYTVRVWTDADEGVELATVAGDDLAGAGTIVAPGGAGVRWAQRVVYASADTGLTVTASDPDGETFAVSGLQVVEDVDPQLGWVAGQRVPVQVSVADPERTVDRIIAGQGVGSWSVTLREVG